MGKKLRTTGKCIKGYSLSGVHHALDNRLRKAAYFLFALNLQICLLLDLHKGMETIQGYCLSNK